MTLVLDACAIIAALKSEPGGALVDSLLSGTDNTCVVHAMNLCEVYYDLVRAAGETRAKTVISQLMEAGIIVAEDMDIDFWQSLGNIKANYPRVPIADCVCIALATRLGTEVITSDHHEFDKVAEQGLCRVRFIR
jgi:PIN domain nuclease of toxin-antitoxin system